MPSRRSGAPPKFAVTQRLDEIVGLFLVAFGVFLALALWTYHPDDPSWSRKVSAGWAVRNYGGRVGAYLAGAFVQLAGSFSALLPLGFVAWGVTAFAGLRSWRPGWRELGGLVILLSAAGMLYKGFAGDPLFGPGALAGGVIGYGVGVLLQSYLGGAGSWVILLASFLASVVATTGISIGRLTALALRGSAWAAARLAWLAGFAAAAAAEKGVPAVRRSAWAALSAAAAWPGRLGGRRSASGANGAGHEDAIGLLEAERSGPPLLPGPAENGGSGRRPKPLPAGPVLPMGAEEEETSGEGPSLFGGRKAPEAPFVLSGPAAEAEEPKGAAPGLPPRLNGRHGADENGGGGPGDGPVLFFQRESQRDGAPEGPAPRLLPSAPSGEKRPAGGLRIGRGRMIGSEPSVAPMPAASPANGKAGAPALSGTGDKGAGDKGKEAPAGPEVPAAAKETGTLEASGVVVRRAGVDGEPEIVRIEDDALVPEAIAAPVPGPERRRPRARAGYALPGLDMFADSPGGAIIVDEEAIRAKSRLLEQTLREFGVEGGITEVKTGPVITIYEFSPAAGVKVSKIAGLSDDLARALSALSVRIVAPIPGRSVVGIEVPNLRRNAVYAKEILASPEFQQAREKLTIGLGKDILGRTALTDLAKIPHLLIAGTTGSGKSVALNMMICSLLLRCHPREVRLLMIDPKMLELSIYEGVPHLLVPVVTDPKKAASALRGVLVEMERRYKMMSEAGVRNIEAYNQLVMEGLGAKEAERRLRRPLGGEEEFPGGGPDFMPYIVVVIDELADLMMVSSRDVEESMIRLAQMARAAGIHLLVATQRPSVDVLTGLIKANFPSRVALRVATRTDSRTILDANGAERLLGKGDMLFIPPGGGATVRIHGAYVSDKEIAYLVAHWKGQGPAAYQEEIFVEKEEPSGAFPGEEDEPDDRYDDAVALVVRTGEASISLIQRHLRIGYNRAARMIERMEQEGVIGPSDGIKRRQVLLRGIPGEE